MPRAEATFHAQPAPATAPGPPGQPGPGQPGPGLAPVEPYVPEARTARTARNAKREQVTVVTVQAGGSQRSQVLRPVQAGRDVCQARCLVPFSLRLVAFESRSAWPADWNKRCARAKEAPYVDAPRLPGRASRACSDRTTGAGHGRMQSAFQCFIPTAARTVDLAATTGLSWHPSLQLRPPFRQRSDLQESGTEGIAKKESIHARDVRRRSRHGASCNSACTRGSSGQEATRLACSGYPAMAPKAKTAAKAAPREAPRAVAAGSGADAARSLRTAKVCGAQYFYVGVIVCACSWCKAWRMYCMSCARM